MESEEELRDIARSKLRAGTLPCEPHVRMWGGPGLGLSCALCESEITRYETEMELEFINGATPRPFRFHTRCFAVWELARREDD